MSATEHIRYCRYTGSNLNMPVHVYLSLNWA